MKQSDIRNILSMTRLASRTVSGFVVLFLALFLSFGPKSSFPETIRNFLFSQDQKEGEFLVARVIDGDTIELSSGEKVRYIGIDTPESVKPNTPVQCFAKEAATRNRELVEGKTVRLVRDVSDRDKYGRLLRYVYAGDVFINEALVREGYARVATFPPDVFHANEFLAAERDAREGKRGLWADGACERE